MTSEELIKIVESAWRRAHGNLYDQYLNPLIKEIVDPHIRHSESGGKLANPAKIDEK